MPNIRGLSYPLRLAGSSLATSTDETLIKESIISVLSTRPGERVMRPRYGVAERTFDAASSETINETLTEVRQKLVSQVGGYYPNVEFAFDAAFDETTEGVLNLVVYWAVDGRPQPSITLRY